MSPAAEKANSSRFRDQLYELIIAIEVAAGCFAWGFGFLLLQFDAIRSVLLFVVGAAVYFLGFYHWATAKGRSPRWALAGLIPFFGVLVLGGLSERPRPDLAQTSSQLFGRSLGFGLFFLLGFVATCFAIQLPMYVSYKRASYDKAAVSDLAALGKTLKKFATERAGYACDARRIPGNVDIVEFIVGPYYGWKGTSVKPEILVRREDDTVCACAVKGSRPQGRDTRYIYRIDVTNGRELTPTIGPCTGKSYGGPEAMCYEESILGPDCEFRKPRCRLCKEIKP